jgi:hypothetical protein
LSLSDDGTTDAHAQMAARFDHGGGLAKAPDGTRERVRPEGRLSAGPAK